MLILFLSSSRQCEASHGATPYFVRPCSLTRRRMQSWRHSWLFPNTNGPGYSKFQFLLSSVLSSWLLASLSASSLLRRCGYSRLALSWDHTHLLQYVSADTRFFADFDPQTCAAAVCERQLHSVAVAHFGGLLGAGFLARKGPGTPV